MGKALNKQGNVSLDELRKVQADKDRLFEELNKRQTALISENEDQENSLLLGVLMTRQHDPVEKQLEVIKKPDFAKLPVAKALLAKKDMKTPLFQQAAAYFDAHAHGQIQPSAIMDAKARANLSTIVSGLEARLHHIESSVARTKKLHENATAR